MKLHRRVRAFTLLEVLLAVVLVVALMGGILGFYRYATETRSYIIGQAESLSGRRLIMERLTLELQTAFVSQQDGLSLQGGWNSISLACATTPKASAWVVREATDSTVSGEQGVQTVSYALRTHEDDEGFLVIDGLERNTHPAIIAGTAELASSSSALLASDIRFVRFRYWDGAAWNDGWNGATLPVAVEIVLGTVPLAEGGDPATYDTPVARRVIFVPGGVTSASATGNTVRGLQGGTSP